MTLSARNHLKGTIEAIELGDILKKGDSVSAVVKATEVMIAKP